MPLRLAVRHLDRSVDVARLLHIDDGRFERRFYWSSPGGETSIAGLGAACRLAARGPSRLATLAHRLPLAAADAAAQGDASPEPGADLIFVGGFAFAPRMGAGWGAFSPAEFVVPQLCAITDPQGTRLIQAAWRARGAPPDRLEKAEARDLDHVAALLSDASMRDPMALPQAAAPRAPVDRVAPLAPTSRRAFRTARERASAAIAAIAAGEVSKVVVAVAESRPLDALAGPVSPSAGGSPDIVKRGARGPEGRSDRLPSPRAWGEPHPTDSPDDDGRSLAATILQRLRRLEPDAYHYIVSPCAGHTWLGATPERLVRVTGRRVETMALAGTSPRGQSAVEDEALAAALLASAKERREHQAVVDMIRAELPGALEAADEPRIRRLAALQHLETPMASRLDAPMHLLDVARRLHPTPALAGTPRGAAMTVIATIEGPIRGWYGGAVGWADGRGDGELAVAIRGVRLADDQATAFAGAGIVAGSEPEREAAEIRRKLESVWASVGG